jgi:hypothetical protein
MTLKKILISNFLNSLFNASLSEDILVNQDRDPNFKLKNGFAGFWINLFFNYNSDEVFKKEVLNFIEKNTFILKTNHPLENINFSIYDFSYNHLNLSVLLNLNKKEMECYFKLLFEIMIQLINLNNDSLDIFIEKETRNTFSNYPFIVETVMSNYRKAKSNKEIKIKLMEDKL